VTKKTYFLIIAEPFIGYVSARITLVDWNGDERAALYEKFRIHKGRYGFQITLRGFQEENEDFPVGNAFGGITENSFCQKENCDLPKNTRKNEKMNKDMSNQNEKMFSTFDRDNDDYCRY
jgi:hypothetical protein